MVGLLSVSYFLVSLLFSLVLFILWLRIFLRYFQVSTLHPVAQGIYSLTNPILLPIEQAIYPKTKLIPQFDWVALTAVIIVEFLKFTLLSLIIKGGVMPLYYTVIFVIADLIVQPLDLLFYALLLRIVFSWFTINLQLQPIAQLITLITNPIVRIGYLILPNISGFDFSPLLMLVIIKTFTLFINAYIPLSMF